MSFDLFWARIIQKKKKEIKCIEDPVPPRKRKAPIRFKLGQQESHHFLKPLRNTANKSILKPLILQQPLTHQI